MIRPIYSIRDIKTRVYDQPMCFHNDESAMRSVRNMMHKVPTLSDYPEDFQLFQVGQFDDATGEVVPGTVNLVCSLLDLSDKRQESVNNELQESESSVSNDASILTGT